MNELRFAVLATNGGIKQKGLVVSSQTHLAARIRDLEHLLNWNDEYVNTSAYRRLAEETWHDYKMRVA